MKLGTEKNLTVDAHHLPRYVHSSIFLTQKPFSLISMSVDNVCEDLKYFTSTDLVVGI